MRGLRWFTPGTPMDPNPAQTTEAAADGATLVVATHELSFVTKVQRIIALRDGVVIHDGPQGDTDVDALVRADAM